jgi:hypothetical protein
MMKLLISAFQHLPKTLDSGPDPRLGKKISEKSFNTRLRLQELLIRFFTDQFRNPELL